MIEKITADGVELALILRRNYHSEGINFLTPNSYSQQLGYMNRPAGYVIKPHLHNPVVREVRYTNEVLLIKSGSVRVDFYYNNKQYLESRILEAGDVILLISGGHGFEMLSSSEIIEIKQGPYAGENDKVRFEPVSSSSVNIIRV